MKTYDLIVIGSGPGGYVSAIRAAQLGLQTAIVEEDELGGVCLNWGCIPTKAILSAAEQYEAVKKGVPGLIVDGQRPDYGAVIDASRKAASRLNKGVTGLLKKNRIEVIRGRGSLAGGGQVAVRSGDSEQMLSAPHIVLATGSTEWVFPGVEVDGKRVLTSREALESRELPASLVIVGGGAVGLEFAYSYGAYGTEITLIEMQDQILPGMDREVAEALAHSFTRRKTKIMTGTAYKGLEVSGSGVVVSAENEKGDLEISAECVLFAVGRRALVAGIGLEAAGVELERGFIRVGADLRTSAAGIWAIGDCNGPPLLAHAASHEGIAAAEFIAGQRKHGIDKNRVPACIYCQPQVASVGLSEEQARAAGYDVRVGKVPFVASGKAIGTGHTDGFVKVVTEARYGELLGCQMIGYGATELINEYVLAMHAEATVRELGEACHAHPTLSEMLMEAALAAEGRSINY